MKRFSLFGFFCILTGAFILTGCQSTNSGGYSRTGWNYSAPAPAESAPDTLSANPVEPVESETITEENTVAQAQTPQRPNLPPVKVALLVPLSGKNAKLGEAMLNAAQIALFDVGHNNFELIPQDTEGTPNGARRAAQTALQNRVQLILGPIFAGSVKAARPVVENAGINMIAFTTDWALAGRNTFIMGFMPFDQVERIAHYAASRGLTEIGVLSPTDNYGDAVLSAYQQKAFDAGLNTVDVKRFSPNSRSHASTMRRFAKYDERQAIAESGGQPTMPFQAMFMPVGGDNAKALSNLAMQYDLRPEDVKRLGTGLWDDSSLATEPAMDRAWFAAPSPAAREDFQNRYFETYGMSPPRLSTLAYDATALAAILARNGLQRGGTPSFDRGSITNPNGFAGIDGIFRFHGNGLVERGLAVLEYRSGNMIVIDEAPRTFQQSRY